MKLNREISKFLSNAPLYKILKTNSYIGHPYDFQDYGVDFYCENEKEFKTFNLEIYPEIVKKHIQNSLAGEAFHGSITEDGKLNFVQHYRGFCLSCKTFYIDIIINVFTTEPFVKEQSFNRSTESHTTCIKKIGQYPSFEISPDREISLYLKKEDLVFYKKALLNLSSGYGIGAFAYLRRVIENEIVRMIKDASDFEEVDEKNIQNIIDKHEKNHSISLLIDETFKYLPTSLKTLGENPFKLMYSQLSVGIHKLTEEDCLEKAQSLNEIFLFVVKRLNERHELNSVKLSIKKLKE